MEKWQQDLEDALARRDLDAAKDILFKSTFHSASTPGSSSSMMTGDITGTVVQQIISNLDGDTQRWLTQQVSE